MKGARRHPLSRFQPPVDKGHKDLIQGILAFAALVGLGLLLAI